MNSEEFRGWVAGWFGGDADKEYLRRAINELDGLRSQAVAVPSAKPEAWLIPTILTFAGVIKTDCPDHLRPELEGTVAWHASMMQPETGGVTDKAGVFHAPKPLYAAPPSPAADERVRESRPDLSELNRLIRNAAYDSRHLLAEDDKWRTDFDGVEKEWMRVLPALLLSHQPVFWYRPCSDGRFEGPIHASVIEQVRKDSGQWVPLYAALAARKADGNGGEG